MNKRKGGPSGYLANLHEGLQQNNESDFKFITKEKTDESIFQKIDMIMPPGMSKKLKSLKNKYFDYNKELGFYNDWEHDLIICESDMRTFNDFSIKSMHAHSPIDYIKVSNFLGEEKKEVIKILTSHSPEAHFLEMYKYYVLRYGIKRAGGFKDIHEKLNEKAFTEADVLIFPCEEAMDPYLETWPLFEKIIKNKQIKYILTGTNELNYEIDKTSYRYDKNISEDEFVVSFVGRHESIKGYDLLKEAAEKVWKKNSKVKFLIGGLMSPLNPLKDKRWIEVGWTSDPGSLINASDIFVLPNRRTYFDLVLLEVLSLGKTTVVSKTGGNKKVERMSEGIIGFDNGNADDLANQILMLSSLERDSIDKLGGLNKQVFKEEFNNNKFASSYTNLIKEINSETPQ
ncbi:glycosyltransferase family 4 protein [Paenibacillus sp. FSL P4-0081]|uniref:glycosyltransferase family 4 protein n=1 Tax=Paenibacillus sp. FSL P4-0081 TaxID=1536769 RepID=UPI0012E08117|nr:glycosyltransferase family 4 protein [Paenibacillus sp. FSL P4-0081]